MAEKTIPKSTLPKKVFAVDVANHELLKLAYDSYLAAKRQVGATTKTRGLVRGGGKKPWRQKGTGRARFGSSRNPIWRGGGIVFGPLGNENYNKRLSSSSKRLALRQALSLASTANKIIPITTFASPEGKTKESLKLLRDNKIDDERARVLLVVEVKDAMASRATNNIQQIKLTSAMYLNVYDILNADKILISKKALETIEKWLGGDK